MSYKYYLVHSNPNHDPKTGQFTFADNPYANTSGATRASQIAKQGVTTANNMSKIVDKFNKPEKKPRADLSYLTDQELRDLLNREEMERRYDNYFNTPTEKKGTKYVKDTLEILAAVGGIAVAGLTAAGLIAGMVKAKKDNDSKKPVMPRFTKTGTSDMNFFK